MRTSVENTSMILGTGCTKAMRSASRTAFHRIKARLHSQNIEILPDASTLNFANGQQALAKEKCRIWLSESPLLHHRRRQCSLPHVPSADEESGRHTRRAQDPCRKKTIHGSPSRVVRERASKTVRPNMVPQLEPILKIFFAWFQATALNMVHQRTSRSRFTHGEPYLGFADLERIVFNQALPNPAFANEACFVGLDSSPNS